MLNQSEFATLNTYMVGIDCLAQIRGSLWRQDGLFTDFKYRNPSTFILDCYMLPFSLASKKTEDGTRIVPPYLNEVIAVLAADRFLASSNELTFPDIISKYSNKLNGVEIDGWYDKGVSSPIYQVNAAYASNSIIARYIFSKPIINTLFNNDYTDYSTITSYYMYLPYIGYVDVDYFNIRNGFTIEYSLDLTHGILTCTMHRQEYEEGLSSEEKRFYRTDINIGIPLTITGGDLSIGRNRTLSRISSAVNMLSGIMSLVPGLGAVGSVIKSTTSTLTTTTGATEQTHSFAERKINKKTGRQQTVRSGITTDRTTHEPTTTEMTSDSSQTSNYRNIASVVNTSINSVVDFFNMQSGSGHAYQIDSNSNWDSSVTPLLYARKPKIIEETKNSLIEYQGRVTNSTVNLSDCRGYLQVGAIHLHIDCTFDELMEIESLLFGGVIINKTKEECPDIVIDIYESVTNE